MSQVVTISRELEVIAHVGYYFEIEERRKRKQVELVRTPEFKELARIGREVKQVINAIMDANDEKTIADLRPKLSSLRAAYGAARKAYNESERVQKIKAEASALRAEAKQVKDAVRAEVFEVLKTYALSPVSPLKK